MVSEFSFLLLGFVYQSMPKEWPIWGKPRVHSSFSPGDFDFYAVKREVKTPKRCHRCGLMKPRKEFRKLMRGGKLRYHEFCRACERAKAKPH